MHVKRQILNKACMNAKVGVRAQEEILSFSVT